MSRKLDTKLAQGLGWTSVSVGENFIGDKKVTAWGIPPKYAGLEPEFWMVAEIPRYSEDGNDMLGLDREMRARGYYTTIYVSTDDPGITAIMFVPGKDGKDYDVYTGEAETEPLARALAAHKALFGEEYADV